MHIAKAIALALADAGELLKTFEKKSAPKADKTEGQLAKEEQPQNPQTHGPREFEF